MQNKREKEEADRCEASNTGGAAGSSVPFWEERRGVAGEPAPKEKDEEEVEEGRAPIRMHDPCEPTKKDIEDHRLAQHLPFRSWCRICVESKGTERDHKRESDEQKAANENAIPTHGIDYAFFSEALEYEGDERKNSNSLKVVIMKEKRTGTCHARCAQKKGGAMSMWQKV